MKLSSLQYFLEITKELNITKTAQRLHISQQALSTHIQRLEEYYGVELFYRKPHLQLTYSGKLLMESAAKMLNENATILSHLSTVRQDGAGSLNIGTSMIPAQLTLSEIIPTFCEAWPNISITLFENSSQDRLQRLLDGALDLNIGVFNQKNPHLDFIPLIDDRLCLFASDTLLERCYGKWYHKIKDAAAVGTDLSEFSELPFLLLTESTQIRKIMDEFFLKAKYQPNIVLESNRTSLLFSLYAKHMGALIAGRMRLSYIRSIAPDTNVFPLIVNGRFPPHQYYIATNNSRYHPQFMRDFITITVDVFSRLSQETSLS